MTRNVMNRRFTLRESILLALLVVIFLIGLFFMLVYYPVRNQRAEIQAQLEDVQDKQLVADILYNRYEEDKEELEEIYALPEDERTVMPKHTDAHEQELLNIVGAIIEVTESHRTNWTISKSDDSVYRRVLSFSFSVNDFDMGYDILKELTSIKFQNQKCRNQVSNLSVSPSSGDVKDGSLTISGTITFFEVE